MRFSYSSVAFIAFASLAPAGGSAYAASCATIAKSFSAASGGLKIDFIRPVVVGRAAEEGLEVLDIVNDMKVDGQLRCKADVFQRFDARISAGAEASTREAFVKVQQAALQTVLGWSSGQAARVVQSMANEAAEYLKASIERGDVEIAGKVEEHAGAAGDVGVIWTRTERAFVIVKTP